MSSSVVKLLDSSFTASMMDDPLLAPVVVAVARPTPPERDIEAVGWQAADECQSVVYDNSNVILPMISLAGLPGAQKTKFLNDFADSLKVEDLKLKTFLFHRSLTKSFNKFESWEPLSLIHQMPKENSALSQLHILQTMAENLKKFILELRCRQNENHANSILITDYNYEDTRAYINLLYEEGNISGFAVDFINRNVDLLVKDLSEKLNIEYIGRYYLDINVENCLDEILNRGVYPDNARFKLPVLQNLERLMKRQFLELEDYYGAFSTIPFTEMEKTPTVEGFREFIFKRLDVMKKASESLAANTPADSHEMNTSY